MVHTARPTPVAAQPVRHSWLDRSRLGATLSTINGLMENAGMLAVAAVMAVLIHLFTS